MEKVEKGWSEGGEGTKGAGGRYLRSGWKVEKVRKVRKGCLKVEKVGTVEKGWSEGGKGGKGVVERWGRDG